MMIIQNSSFFKQDMKHERTFFIKLFFGFDPTGEGFILEVVSLNVDRCIEFHLKKFTTFIFQGT